METTELVADNVWVATFNPILADRVEGPPFQIRFGIEHGKVWPDVTMTLFVGEHPIMVIQTTEPRIKAAAAWLLSEVS